MILNQDLARSVLSKPHVFAKNAAVMTGQRDDASTWKLRLALPLVRHMLASDPPDHQRLRNPLAPHFRIPNLERFSPAIQARTDQAIEDTIRHEGEVVDIVHTISESVPRKVILDILGIHERYSETLGKSSRYLSEVLIHDPRELRAAGLDMAKILGPVS